MQAMAGQLILNRIAHPVLLVDASNSLRFANARGRTALESKLAICEIDGRLHASDPSDDLALDDALHSMLVAAPHVDQPVKRFVRLRGTNWQQKIGLSLSALRPAETMGAFGTLPLAMLVLYDASLIATCDAFVLQELFGLTPAEANVGTLLCAGETVESIALKRGVAISTIRSQLRALMEKTGAKSQSDLLRIFVSLPHGLTSVVER